MQPDHTENSYMFDLLDVTKNTGITLTESLAMLPQNSVSTLVFGLRRKCLMLLKLMVEAKYFI